MALAGRATTTHRAGHVGAADLHLPPRAAGEPGRRGRRRRWAAPGFTLGIGPSHRAGDRGHATACPTTTPGRHTEEYVEILAALLRGEAVERRRATSFRVHVAPAAGRRRSRCRCSCRRWRPACCGWPASSPTAPSCGWATPAPIEIARRAADPTPRPSRRAAGAAHRRRPAGRRARRRRRGPRRRPREQFAVYGDAAELPAASSTTAAPPGRPTPRSSATRRGRRSSRRCSTPAPPTSGPPSSPSATTLRLAPAHPRPARGARHRSS